MNKKITLIIVMFIIGRSFAKNNKTHKTHDSDKLTKNRYKRAIAVDDKIPWSIRKYLEDGNFFNLDTQTNDRIENDAQYDDEIPFWGTRGKRSSEESLENELPLNIPSSNHNNKLKLLNNKDHISPYRNYIDITENDPFWGNRGKRQEEDSQFWGSRGRRITLSPIGNKAVRAEYSSIKNPELVNEEEPFWGNRGRRDDDPFWGSRGRRLDTDPFWSTRGRREELLHYLGKYGFTEATEPFWGNKSRRKEDLQRNIYQANQTTHREIKNPSRLKRTNTESSFWKNRGRDSKLKYLFNDSHNNRLQFPYKNSFLRKESEAKTVYNDRIYAEQPHYIVLDRSSRSSSEEDPFYISRGKKKIFNHNVDEALRDRRGSFEELVKSVRNDPYYISRGKKDSEAKTDNPTSLDEFLKGRELICATIELLAIKTGIEKRENDERDRTILKKLAAQLQNDPFFVSRGKKYYNLDVNEVNLKQFLNHVAEMCD